MAKEGQRLERRLANSTSFRRGLNGRLRWRRSPFPEVHEWTSILSRPLTGLLPSDSQELLGFARIYWDFRLLVTPFVAPNNPPFYLLITLGAK